MLNDLTTTPIAALTSSDLASLLYGNGYDPLNATYDPWHYNYNPVPVVTGSLGAISTSNNTASTPSASYTYRDPYADIKDRLDAIESRLCILRPALDKHKKFAALERAYNNYKLIEKMCYEVKEP